jgi:hypothetical protein
VKYPSDLVTEEEEVGLFWEWGSKDNETQTVTREREREREMGVDLEYIRAQVTIRVFIRVLGFDCVSLAI